MYDNLPSYFNNKYNSFCGSLPDIIAVIAGVKPMARLNFSKKGRDYYKLIKFIRKYDIFTLESQYGKKYFIPRSNEISSSESKEGKLTHFYLSRSKKILNRYRFSDPDFELGKTSRPSKKHIAALKKFAQDLGYPDCCIKSYFKDGPRKKIFSYNQLPQGNRAPFYANNFLHSISNYYLSFHFPCSLECHKTKIYNKKIFDAIQKIEPDFSRRLRKILTLPMLVWFNTSNLPFDDRIIVLFNGHFTNDTIIYSRCFILRSNYPNNKKFKRKSVEDLFYFKAGDKVRNTAHKIYIYQGKELIHTIKKQSKFDGVLFHFFT